MEYFLVTAGEQTKPVFSSVLDSLIPQRLPTKEQAEKLPQTSMLRLSLDSDERLPDVITRQACLISDGVRKVLEKYDKSIVFRALSLVDKNTSAQFLYWIMGLDKVNCLSAKALFYPNGTIKKIVLNEEKIGDKAIFLIGGMVEKFICVRLDVAESLLRRPFYGIEFTPVAREEE